MWTELLVPYFSDDSLSQGGLTGCTWCSRPAFHLVFPQRTYQSRLAAASEAQEYVNTILCIQYFGYKVIRNFQKVTMEL